MSSELRPARGEKDYQRCPRSPDGKHQPHPPPAHIGDQDETQAFVDVSCRYCGQSGCVIVITQNTEVDR